MTLSDTRKAIRELPDDEIWVSQFSIADLKELEAKYSELENIAIRIEAGFQTGMHERKDFEALSKFLVPVRHAPPFVVATFKSREDPDSAETEQLTP